MLEKIKESIKHVEIILKDMYEKRTTYSAKELSWRNLELFMSVVENQKNIISVLSGDVFSENETEIISFNKKEVVEKVIENGLIRLEIEIQPNVIESWDPKIKTEIYNLSGGKKHEEKPKSKRT